MLKKNNYWKKFFVFCCGPGKHQLLRTSLFCIVVSLFTGALLLLVLGKNPLEAYKSILQGAGLLPKLRYAGKKKPAYRFYESLKLHYSNDICGFISCSSLEKWHL